MGERAFSPTLMVGTHGVTALCFPPLPWGICAHLLGRVGGKQRMPAQDKATPFGEIFLFFLILDMLSQWPRGGCLW